MILFRACLQPFLPPALLYTDCWSPLSLSLREPVLIHLEVVERWVKQATSQPTHGSDYDCECGAPRITQSNWEASRMRWTWTFWDIVQLSFCKNWGVVMPKSLLARIFQYGCLSTTTQCRSRMRKSCWRQLVGMKMAHSLRCIRFVSLHRIECRLSLSTHESSSTQFQGSKVQKLKSEFVELHLAKMR